MGTGVPQQTTMLNWANLSERAQKIKGLNFCASQFVTEDEVKYCVAKLFSGEVKYATMVSTRPALPVLLFFHPLLLSINAPNSINPPVPGH